MEVDLVRKVFKSQRNHETGALYQEAWNWKVLEGGFADSIERVAVNPAFSGIRVRPGEPFDTLRGIPQMWVPLFACPSTSSGSRA